MRELSSFFPFVFICGLWMHQMKVHTSSSKGTLSIRTHGRYIEPFFSVRRPLTHNEIRINMNHCCAQNRYNVGLCPCN